MGSEFITRVEHGKDEPYTVIFRTDDADKYKHIEDECRRMIGHEKPTVDAVPVKHGKWTIDRIDTYDLAYGTTGYEPVYRCSVCGLLTESYLRLDEPIMPEDADFPNYCPNCGAKMDGADGERRSDEDQHIYD